MVKNGENLSYWPEAAIILNFKHLSMLVAYFRINRFQ